MAVNVKMGVDIGAFKSGIQQGQNVLKGLNAEMKSTEAEFKATGNAEQLLANKTKTLNSQLQVQKGIVDQASQALKKMDAAGIQPTDKAYQQLYATMMNAQAGMYETQAAIDALGASAAGAAGEADQLTNSVNGISKKMSLDQVISGLDTIKRGLESAAKVAVDLGNKIWENITDTARYSDDIATQAMVLGMDVEKYQQYKGVFDTVGEITVQEWMKAKQKVQKAINDPSQDQTDILALLGINTHEITGGKYGMVEGAARNFEDVFWEIGDTLRKKVESGEMTQDLADTYANALFGKGFAQLNPMFALGKEGFAAALNEQVAASKEAIEANAALNDKLIELENTFNALKVEVTGAIAPALTEVAGSLDKVLTSILDYLKTEKGQEALSKLGDAVSGLFGDLSKIDPEQVVSGFVDVFTKVTGGIQWLVDNADTAKGILATVVTAWGAITIGENVLKIVNLVNGISGLSGSAAAAAGTTAGSSWASAFASAAMKAAPFLAFLYTLLNPAGSAGNNLDAMTDNGQVTEAGWEFWKNNPDEWVGRLESVGSAFGDLASILSSDEAVNIIGDLTLTDEDVVKKLQEQVGIVPIDATMIAVDGTAESLAGQIGTIVLPAEVKYVETTGDPVDKVRTPTGPLPGQHANGLPWVPYDGYLARLHMGERVLTASENRNYTFYNNTYMGSVNLNNGLEIEQLTESIARNNRRKSAGYGS